MWNCGIPDFLITRYRDPANATKMTKKDAEALVKQLNEQEESEGIEGWIYQSESFGDNYIVSVSDRVGLMGYL